LLEYIDALENSLGKRANKVLLPMQPGDVPDTWADVAELFNDFGYQPKVDVQKGVKNFSLWFRDYYKI